MFSRLPSLNSFRMFEAASRHRSFKRAAAELNVTATAVSHQIRRLEEQLGTVLFLRKTRSIELTLEGQKLSHVCHQVFEDLLSAVKMITKSQSTVTVSTTASFAAMWLIPNLEKFYQHHPDIDVTIKTGESLDDLNKDRRLDLAIRYGKFEEVRTNAEKLVTETVGLYATSAYLSAHDTLENTLLLETEWHNKSLPGVNWEQYNEKQTTALTPLKVMRFEQEHHVIQAALAGQGVALISTLLIQTALRQNWLVEVQGSQKVSGLSYYTMLPDHRKPTRQSVLFRDWIHDELSKRD